MVLVIVVMSPKVNMMTIKKVKPRVALFVSLDAHDQGEKLTST